MGLSGLGRLFHEGEQIAQAIANRPANLDERNLRNALGPVVLKVAVGKAAAAMRTP